MPEPLPFSSHCCGHSPHGPPHTHTTPVLTPRSPTHPTPHLPILPPKHPLNTPHPQVLFLDSDCLPVLEPSPLFEAGQYRAGGNLFWPDFHVGDSYFPVTPMWVGSEGVGVGRRRARSAGFFVLEALLLLVVVLLLLLGATCSPLFLASPPPNSQLPILASRQVPAPPGATPLGGRRAGAADRVWPVPL